MNWFEGPGGCWLNTTVFRWFVGGLEKMRETCRNRPALMSYQNDFMVQSVEESMLRSNIIACMILNFLVWVKNVGSMKHTKIQQSIRHNKIPPYPSIRNPSIRNETREPIRKNIYNSTNIWKKPIIKEHSQSLVEIYIVVLLREGGCMISVT